MLFNILSLMGKQTQIALLRRANPTKPVQTFAEENETRKRFLNCITEATSQMFPYGVRSVSSL